MIRTIFRCHEIVGFLGRKEENANKGLTFWGVFAAYLSLSPSYFSNSECVFCFSAAADIYTSTTIYIYDDPESDLQKRSFGVKHDKPLKNPKFPSPHTNFNFKIASFCGYKMGKAMASMGISTYSAPFKPSFPHIYWLSSSRSFWRAPPKMALLRSLNTFRLSIFFPF